jgi:adenylate cyclase, class 2
MGSALRFPRYGAGYGNREGGRQTGAGGRRQEQEAAKPIAPHFQFMPIEIEKKFRLTKTQREQMLKRLPEIGARLRAEEFEENTLYGGVGLEMSRSVLRLRRVGKGAILTYKERLPKASSIKHQREDETRVDDPEAMDAILDALGFTPALVYEKRRQRWRLGKAEIVIDDLPFGLFMEIEASESDIKAIESKLGIKGLKAEHSTYPQLTLKHGKRYGSVIEARFIDGQDNLGREAP